MQGIKVYPIYHESEKAHTTPAPSTAGRSKTQNKAPNAVFNCWSDCIPCFPITSLAVHASVSETETPKFQIRLRWIIFQHYFWVLSRHIRRKRSISCSTNTMFWKWFNSILWSTAWKAWKNGED